MKWQTQFLTDLNNNDYSLFNSWKESGGWNNIVLKHRYSGDYIHWQFTPHYNVYRMLRDDNYVETSFKAWEK